MIYAEELHFCLGFLKICLPVKSRKLAIEDSCNCPAEPAVSLYSLFSATVLVSLVSDVIPLYATNFVDIQIDNTITNLNAKFELETS